MSGIVDANSASFSASELSAALGVPVSGNGIAGVVTDSRQVRTDNLFVALRGEKFDGHHFLTQADAAGARVVADERGLPVPWPGQQEPIVVPDTRVALGHLARYHRRRFAIPVIGVTGSYGKTTTRALIHAALSTQQDTLTSQANFNNEIGLPLTVLQLTSEHGAAVLEMGMRGTGQIDYLARIAEPTIGVITNVGPQHVELLGSVENIAAAKAELLAALPEGGVAILPADSPSLPYLQSRCPGPYVTFGTHPNANFRATNIVSTLGGTIRFTLLHRSEETTIDLPLPGAHNAVNACAALAVAAQLGISPAQAAAGLAAVEIPGARMRVWRLENGITVIDDCYNAGPDSMRAALTTLLDFPGSDRRIAVLGAMRELGAFEEMEHQKIGQFAGQFLDGLIGVCGETRPLLNAAVASAKQLDNFLLVHYCDDAAEAATKTPQLLKAGDVVLVKGSRSVGLEVVVESIRSHCG